VVLVIPYYRTVPLKVHRLSLLFGLVGGVIWILVCRQHWEQYAASALGLGGWMVSGQRAAFDPLTTFDGRPLWLGCFLAVRFLGLVALVPLIEEFFLRGFLMRFFRQADWWVIPWGDVTVGSALIATAYGVLSHPAEAFAAAIWFTWITLLYVRTRSIWDCVLAHALTNLVLGIYVLAWRDWSLW
jgi:CAAX prenyl protease-like protein